MVESLPSKYEALTSNPSDAKKISKIKWCDDPRLQSQLLGRCR
jgi:hypothetical protein